MKAYVAQTLKMNCLQNGTLLTALVAGRTNEAVHDSERVRGGGGGFSSGCEVRVDQPSDLGAWSYAPPPAELAQLAGVEDGFTCRCADRSPTWAISGSA